MTVNLTRMVPKINTLYLIYEGGEKGEIGLDAIIIFTIIDWIYKELLKKHNSTRVGMDADLYTYLGIGETNFEKILRGKSLHKIEKNWDENYSNHQKLNRYSKVRNPRNLVNNILSGEMILTVDGVSRKQWLRYFSLWHKIRDLRQLGEYPEEIEEAKRRRKRFEKKVKQRIKNGEINETACNIKIDMEKKIFGSEKSKFENIQKMKNLIEHFNREEYIRYSQEYQEEFEVLLEQMKAVTSELDKMERES